MVERPELANLNNCTPARETVQALILDCTGAESVEERMMVRHLHLSVQKGILTGTSTSINTYSLSHIKRRPDLPNLIYTSPVCCVWAFRSKSISISHV